MAFLDSSVVTFLTLQSLLLLSLSFFSLGVIFLLSQAAGLLFSRLSGRHPVPPNGAVFITGCSTGIGRTGALHLARMGLVVFAGVRKEKDAELLRKDSPKIVPVLVDVVDHAQVKAAAVFVEEQLRKMNLRLVGIVNNAGISHPGLVELQDIGKLRQMYEVNVFGAVDVTQTFLPLLRKYPVDGQTPRIVMVSSAGANSTGTGIVGYCSTKKALEGITDGFRMELKPWNIDVISLQPAPLLTPMQDILEGISFDAITTPEELKEVDPEVTSLYRKRADQALKMGGQLFKLIMQTTKVSDEAFEAALFDKRPKARYDVGYAATVLRFLSLLPERVLDIVNSI